MKHILTIWLLMFAVSTTFSQSHFKYVCVYDDGDASNASFCRQIESYFYQIGIRPIKFGDMYKDFSINPYEVIHVPSWNYDPFAFDSFYIDLHVINSFGTRRLYAGSLNKFLKKPDSYLQRSSYSVPYVEKTAWGENSLKSHWSKSGAIDIEGIYQSIEPDGYRIGIIEENNKLKIIILDDYPVWKTGDVLGEIFGATNTIFNLQWRTPSKLGKLNVFGYMDHVGLHVNFSKTDVEIEELHFLKNYSPQKSDIQEGGNSVSSGSGIILTSDGIIATNYHVVKNASSILIQIQSSGKVHSYKAQIVIDDQINDLCLLKIVDDDFKNLPAIPYNFSSQICDVGTNIFSMGYPMSSILGQEVKVTDGLISSKTGYKNNVVMYQISAPIQPGNSGGPLFDKKGNLIGITNAGVPDAQNVGYAIKSSYLKNLIDAAPQAIKLPDSNTISKQPLTEQIKILTPYVVFIKVEQSKE